MSWISRLAPTLSLVIATLLLTLAGCGDSSSSSGKGGAGSTDRPFRFINRGDIITLDINQMSYLQDFRVTYAIRDGLFTYDPQTFKPVPSLATETTQSPDKKVWTIKLRDAKWNNGDPVTAADFVFSWRLLLESPGEYTYLLYYVVNAENYEKSYREADGKVKFDEVGLKAIDDKTIQITLLDPVPFLPDLLAFPTFYPRHAKSMEPFQIKDDKGRVSYDAKYTRPENVVTNGAFKLTSWEPGKRLLMEASPTYWDAGAVKLKAIEMVVNNDPQSAFLQYDQEKVDWLADVSAEIASKLKEANRPDLRVTPAYGTAFLSFNVAEKIPSETGDAKNPLSDARVRKALAMTIDKKYIVDTITRMGEKTANSYIPPGFFEGYQSVPAPDYNIDEAKKLLAEAGYPDGKGFPTLTFSYNSDNPTRKAFGEFLSQSWRDKLGITVELRALELKTYRKKVTDKEYTIAAVAWYGDYMDLSTWTDKYKSTSLNNDTNWGPKAYDDLVLKASQEADEAKRMDYHRQAEAMLNTELPIVPLYHYVNVTLHRDNVTGMVPNAKLLIVWKNIGLK